MKSTVASNNVGTDALATTPTVVYPPLPIIDTGLVRLGGQAPLFSPAIVADPGLVRLGGQSPIF